MTADDVVEHLRAFREALEASLPASAGTTTVATGWATVELERATRELADAFGVPASRFVPGHASELLGARCLVADAVLPGGFALVVLEPATEGRLAATLARVGEGPAAIWLALAGPGRGRLSEPRNPFTTTSGRPGPVGVERLVVGGPSHGPHRLLVDGPGTIHA